MANKSISQFPVKGKIKEDGEEVVITAEVNIAGIKCYTIETPRGRKIGDIMQHLVVPYPDEVV